jgi:hypothetical protein
MASNYGFAERRNAGYVRPDRKVAVRGHWVHRGGCLWLGEITVLTADKVMHFSSTTPMTTEGLAGYATDEYMRTRAARFHDRQEVY